MKIKGVNRSPYWIMGVNVSIGETLRRMQNKVQEIRFKFQEIHSSQKPKACLMSQMYYQLSLSKAFEKSILISIPRVAMDFKEWMVSWTRMTLPMIWRPSTYPICSGHTSMRRRGLRQVSQHFRNDFVNDITQRNQIEFLKIRYIVFFGYQGQESSI